MMIIAGLRAAIEATSVEGLREAEERRRADEREADERRRQLAAMQHRNATPRIR